MDWRWDWPCTISKGASVGGSSKGAQACSLFGLGKVVYFDSQRIGRKAAASVIITGMGLRGHQVVREWKLAEEIRLGTS